MLDFIKENRQFVLLFVLWILVGMYLKSPPAYLLVTLTVLAFQRQERYMELFISFFAVLIISDNRFHHAEWTDTFKNVYLVILALILFRDKRLAIDFQIAKLFLPFFILAGILVTRSEDPLNSIQKTLSYLLLIAVVPNFIIAGYKKSGTDFLKSLIWFVCLLLSYGLFMKFVFPRWSTLDGRFMGIFGNPNGAGVFCMMFFILVFVLHEKFDLFKKNELRLVYGIILLTIIFSGSRTAIFSILIFLLFRYFNKISPSLGFAMLILIIIGYEAIFLNFQTIVNSLGLSDYFRLDTIEDGSGRFIAWNFAFENVKENWWFGKGFGFTEYLFKFYEFELSLLGHQGNAHNSYLTIWLDTGLIGLVLFLRAIFLLFIKGAKINRTSLGVMYAVLFSVYFESWLIGSLNPITIQVYIILTVLTSDYFNVVEDKSNSPVAEVQALPATS